MQSSYAEFHREWHDGDRIEIALPMHNTVERLPDGSDWVAILHGPILLAAPGGTNNLIGLRADDARMAHVASGSLVSLDKVPTLLVGATDVPAHIIPAPAAGPLHFRLMDILDPASPHSLPLVPFFRLHDERYQIYWQIMTGDQFAERHRHLAAEERSKAAHEAATLDAVAIGEQQPEVEHEFVGENTQTGIFEGRRWRDGRWFQYTLKTQNAKAADLVIAYWGGDTGRTFDILVNGTLLATETLNQSQPGKFFEKRYALPASVLMAASDGRVTIKFVTKVWVAGGIFYLRLMKPGAVADSKDGTASIQRF
jgi:hypothetical protein